MPDDSKSTLDRAKENLIRFLSPNSKPTMETFPELIDCVVWLRFSLALFFGLWIGNENPSKGGTNLMLGLNLIAFVPILYCQTFLGADQESYGPKLLFSGIVQGLALAVLIWIYCYTDQHPEDEAAFVEAYGNPWNAGAAATGAGLSGEAGDAPPLAEESEF